jgi:hypothetical protein
MASPHHHHQFQREIERPGRGASSSPLQSVYHQKEGVTSESIVRTFIVIKDEYRKIEFHVASIDKSSSSRSIDNPVDGHSSKKTWRPRDVCSICATQSLSSVWICHGGDSFSAIPKDANSNDLVRSPCTWRPRKLKVSIETKRRMTCRLYISTLSDLSRAI